MPAELPVLDRIIGDWFDHGLIRLTMAGVIARSSNIGTALAADAVHARAAVDLPRQVRPRPAAPTSGMPGETRGLLPPRRHLVRR